MKIRSIHSSPLSLLKMFMKQTLRKKIEEKSPENTGNVQK